jgi:hypothetical protein
MANTLAKDTAPDLQRLLVEDEMMKNLELIKKSRESIDDTKRHFADSFDRLVESQKLLRRLRACSMPEVGGGATTVWSARGFWLGLVLKAASITIVPALEPMRCCRLSYPLGIGSAWQSRHGGIIAVSVDDPGTHEAVLSHRG